MTYAPATLTAARSLILRSLPQMDPASVGIVGDDSHAQSGSSYHLGKDALRSDSYSITESSRDRKGLTNAASALDFGMFTSGKHNLRTFSKWLVAECKAGAADTRDIREVIYSPDGKTVKRWDRLGIRSSGPSSHLTHTHISWFRDSEHHDKAALFRRYFEHIGLLKPPPPPEEDLPVKPAEYTALLLTALKDKNVRAEIGEALLEAVVGSSGDVVKGRDVKNILLDVEDLRAVLRFAADHPEAIAAKYPENSPLRQLLAHAESTPPPVG